MTIKDIPIGTKLEIKLYKNDDIDKYKTFTSTLDKVLDEKTIIIGPAHFQEQQESIPDATKINIFLVYESSKFFIFDGVVMEKRPDEIYEGSKVLIISDLLRVRLRENFRFAYEVPIKYKVFDSIEDAIGNTQPYKDSVSKDLSGGDLSFICDDELSHDQLVDLRVSLGEGSNDEIRLFGSVTRVIPVMIDDVKKFGVGIVYKSISGTDVNKISKFINNKLINLRQRGLI